MLNLGILLVAFSTGLQAGLIKAAFGLWLKDSGMSLVYLGLISLIYLPFALKILWLPLVENMQLRIQKYGFRKTWILMLDLLLSLMTLGFCFMNPVQMRAALLILYASVYAFLVSTKESMAIAYQMENIERKHWGTFEGVIAGCYHFGFLLTGYCLYACSQYFSWDIMFAYLSILLFVLFLCTFFIKEVVIERKMITSHYKKFEEPIMDLLKQNKNIIYSLIAFLIFYRLQDRLLMSVSSYFIIDMNYSKFDFAKGKILGIFATILGGFFASFCMRKFDYKPTLVYGILFHALCATLFLAQCFLPKSYLLFYGILVLEKLSRGFEATVFYAYQRLFLSKEHRIVQFSILTGLERFSGTIIGSFSGMLIEFFGWEVFFIFTFIGIIPALLLLRKL